MTTAYKPFNDRPIKNGARSVFCEGVSLHKSGDYDSNLYIERETSSAKIVEAYAISSSGALTGVVIPDGTTRLEIKNRSNATCNWGFQSGNVYYTENPYNTLRAYEGYYNDFANQGLFNKTLYFSADSSGTTEIELIFRIGYMED